MDYQAKRNTDIQEGNPSGSPIALDDFDRWANAVRQQMLDCLQKRQRR